MKHYLQRRMKSRQEKKLPDPLLVSEVVDLPPLEQVNTKYSPEQYPRIASALLSDADFAPFVAWLGLGSVGDVRERLMERGEVKP